MNANLRQLAEKWPSAMFAREEVGTFTGGMISPKTMANLDSLGEGPTEGVVKIGKKVGYLVNHYISWLESRTTVKSGTHSCGSACNCRPSA